MQRILHGIKMNSGGCFGELCGCFGEQCGTRLPLCRRNHRSVDIPVQSRRFALQPRHEVGWVQLYDRCEDDHVFKAEAGSSYS